MSFKELNLCVLTLALTSLHALDIGSDQRAEFVLLDKWELLPWHLFWISAWMLFETYGSVYFVSVVRNPDLVDMYFGWALMAGYGGCT